MQFVFSKIVLKTLQWCWWRWTCVFEAIPFNSAELLFLILTNFCYLGPFFNCSFQRSIKNILYIASVAGILIFKVFYPKNLCIINKYISISQIHLMIILMLVCQKHKRKTINGNTIVSNKEWKKREQLRHNLAGIISDFFGNIETLFK